MAFAQRRLATVCRSQGEGWYGQTWAGFVFKVCKSDPTQWPGMSTSSRLTTEQRAWRSNHYRLRLGGALAAREQAKEEKENTTTAVVSSPSSIPRRRRTCLLPTEKYCSSGHSSR